MSEDEAIAEAYYDIQERIIKNNIIISSLNSRAEGERLTLNSQQKIAVDTIISAIDVSNTSRLFFIDGPGGSGKTWIYTCLFHILIGRRLQVACAAWTAANLLPSGRTSASLFKLAVTRNCETSSHKRQMKDAGLLDETDVFIWDEASMIPRLGFEAADAVLRDITQVDRLEGKIVILGGDSRQVLPVFRRGSRVDQVNACIKQSSLWSQFKILRLFTNMRVTTGDSNWTNFLLCVGDGTANDSQGRVQLPAELMHHGDIVRELYGDSIQSSGDLSDQAIPAPT